MESISGIRENLDFQGQRIYMKKLLDSDWLRAVSVASVQKIEGAKSVTRIF